MELLTFNVDDGYTEALLRGMRASFLRKEDYDAMRDCTDLADFKMVLESSDYLAFFQSETGTMAAATIKAKMQEKLARELEHLKAQAAPELYQFLDKVAHQYMIDTVVNLIELIKNREHVLNIPAPDPLGTFREIADILRFEGDDIAELYELVLIDTPVGQYFQRFLAQLMAQGEFQHRNMQEVNRQFAAVSPSQLRNSLKKIWLEDLYALCRGLNGTSRELVEDLLKFEADCMTLQIVYNSIRQPDAGAHDNELLGKRSFFPDLGHLYPDCTVALEKATDIQSLRAAVEQQPVYYGILKNVPDPLNVSEMNDDSKKSIDDYMFEAGTRKYSLAFEQQFHYAAFYAYLKLKEQEIRNTVLLADMVKIKPNKSSLVWRKYETLVPLHCLKD